MPVQKMKTMPITRIAHAKPTFGSDATKRTTSRSDAGCTAAFLAEEVADCCKGGGEDEGCSHAAEDAEDADDEQEVQVFWSFSVFRPFTVEGRWGDGLTGADSKEQHATN